MRTLGKLFSSPLKSADFAVTHHPDDSFSKRHPLARWGLALIMAGSAQLSSAQTQVIVSDSNLQGWAVASQRADSNALITTNQPRSGSGSLELSTQFVTPGQDKVDFELLWDPQVFPLRTLTDLSALGFEYYRDSGSAVGGQFHPVLRLRWYNDAGTPADTTDDSFGSFIYEEVYQGVNPVPEDQWVSKTIDLAGDHFWVFCNQCQAGASGVVQNYSSSLNDWLAGPITGQGGDPVPPDMSQGNTFIFGVNTGIGSGWNDDLLMWVDNIRVGFGATDDVLYNFEGPLQDADLLVEKTVDNPGPVSVGDTLVYTITVTNQGPGDATTVQVTDMLPASLMYISDDCNALVMGQDVVWDVGTLLNGEADICMVTTQVIGTGPVENSVLATAAENDPDMDNNMTVVPISGGALPAAEVVPVLSLGSLLLLVLAFFLVGWWRLRPIFRYRCE